MAVRARRAAHSSDHPGQIAAHPTVSFSPAKPWRKSAVIVTIKVVVTLSLLYVVLSGVDLGKLREIVLTVPPQVFGLAIVLHIVVFLLGGLRWWLLARRTGVDRPFAAVLPSYYLGVFSNNFLPTGVGGDVVRILHLKQLNIGLHALVAATISDRLIGLTAVLATGLAALAVTPGVRIGDEVRLGLLTLSLTAIASVWLLAHQRFGALVERLAQRFHQTRIRKMAFELVHSIHRLHNHRNLVMGALALSVAVQSLVTISYYLLARSIGLEQPLTLFFAVIPVVFLAATLPISIGGLGVREGTFVALMIAAGAEKSLVVSVSVAYLAVFWLSTLPGALGLLASPGKVKKDKNQ